MINNGEDAFSSILEVDLPEDINLVKIQQQEQVCVDYFSIINSIKINLSNYLFKDFQITWQEFKVEHSGKNRLHFYLGNPISGGTELRFNIELSGKATTTDLTSDFTFIFNVTSVNDEKPSTLFDNILVVGIPLRINITIEPFGYV